MSPDPNEDPFKKRDSADRDHITREKSASASSLARAKLADKAKSKPAFVKTREVFESHPDAALNAGIRAIIPEQINGALTSWTSLTSGLDQVFADVHKRNLAVTEFQGKAANASMAGSDRYAKIGVQFATDSAEVKTRIEAVYHAASAVKMAAREIPPKPERPNMGSITDIVGNGPKEAAYSEAKQQTLYAVNSILKPGFWPAGDAVPSYAAPPAIVGDGPGATNGPGSRNAPSGTSPGGAPQQPGGPGAGRPPGEDAVNAANAAPQAGDPVNNATSQAANQASPHSQQQQAATTPANTANALAPGGPGGPGSPGNPAGIYPPGPGYGPGRGPNDRRDQQENNAAVVGAPIGRGPAGGMPVAGPAMGHPGVPAMPRPARKNEEEERERKTPAHLINAINGSELLGPPIKATPPVLGDWDYTNDRPASRDTENAATSDSSAPGATTTQGGERG